MLLENYDVRSSLVETGSRLTFDGISDGNHPVVLGRRYNLSHQRSVHSGMRNYRIFPVRLAGGYYEPCEAGDPQTVWSVYAQDDADPWLTWIADTPSSEMALALTDALRRDDESGTDPHPST